MSSDLQASAVTYLGQRQEMVIRPPATIQVKLCLWIYRLSRHTGQRTGSPVQINVDDQIGRYGENLKVITI
jgi:hypothetical protein